MNTAQYENRPARQVRAISMEDANDVIEYPSISAAAKAIEGKVSQRNVRALITRVIMKNEPLLGRKWSVSEEIGSTSEPSMTLPRVPSVPLTPSARLDGTLAEELALKRQQLAFKEKQIDLLLRYIDSLKDKNDPFAQTLMKQFLSI